ncbi:MAG: hypothetical protein ACT4O2_12445 [Beijerinckiaceae bacterium]
MTAGTTRAGRALVFARLFTTVRRLPLDMGTGGASGRGTRPLWRMHVPPSSARNPFAAELARDHAASRLAAVARKTHRKRF